MFRVLDGLSRRLEELFGPDPEPREHVSALPVEGEAATPSSVPPTEDSERTPDIPSDPPAIPQEPTTTPGSPYTLGQLIEFLEGLERNREFQRLQQQEQLRRNPVNAAMNAAYVSVLRWQPDESQMPGIRRIELLCDLEPGDAGINAAKVRRLRAGVCQRQHWEPQHANQLTLDEAADVLQGIRRVPIDELQRAGQDAIHHGLATLDTIRTSLAPDAVIQITGLSCKVIVGTTPTACPDANPVLPPSMLSLAEQAIRRLHPLPPGTTIHWVGHDTGMRNRCRCHPDAPFAAPFDQHRWTVPPSEPRGGETETTTSVQIPDDTDTARSGSTRKTGRPPNPMKQEVVKFVRELRDKNTPWKDIPEAVFKEFGIRYTSETLRGYLNAG